MKFINVAEAKAKFSQILRDSKKDDIIVTSRGKPRALIQSLEGEDLEEFIILNSKKLRRQIEEAWDGYEKGNTVDLEEALKRG